MIINQGNLKTLYVAFKAAFQGGLGQAAPQFGTIATTVPSTTGSEEYGWLGKLPSLREWVGDRVINGIASSGYTIKNKPFELTIAVPRPAIEDDQYGVYTPLFTEMGRSAAAHPDETVFGALAANGNGYDGQAFFSGTHPVLNANGKAANQSNDLGGAGTAWYVLDNSRALKPMIFQQRKSANFVAKDRETDDNVFDRNEFRYGIDTRDNVGYGFWQMAVRSKQTLDEAGLTNAITALTSRVGDYGRPLGLVGTHLVVPPTLEFAATALLKNAFNAAGATNTLAGRLQILVSPWLS